MLRVVTSPHSLNPPPGGFFSYQPLIRCKKKPTLTWWAEACTRYYDVDFFTGVITHPCSPGYRGLHDGLIVEVITASGKLFAVRYLTGFAFFRRHPVAVHCISDDTALPAGERAAVISNGQPGTAGNPRATRLSRGEIRRFSFSEDTKMPAGGIPAGKKNNINNKS